MRVLAPFELRECLAYPQSFAVIGNSSTALRHRRGEKIDAQDCIARYNAARVTGYEPFIGSRTDLLFANAYQNNSNCPPLSETSPRAVVCILTDRDGNVPPDDFISWIGETPVCFTLGPDLIHLPLNRRSRAFTTGTYSLFFLQWLFEIESIYLSGFSLFQEALGHYWSKEIPPSEHFHDLDVERKVFRRLCRDLGERLEATEDVLGLMGDRELNPQSRKLHQKMAGRVGQAALKAGIRLRRLSEWRP